MELQEVGTRKNLIDRVIQTTSFYRLKTQVKTEVQRG